MYINVYSFLINNIQSTESLSVSRQTGMKRVMHCDEGGFVSMQLHLIQGKEIKCAGCRKLLDSKGFDMDKYQADVDAYLEGDRAMTREMEWKQKIADGEEAKPKSPEQKKDENIEPDSLAEESRIQELLQSVEGVITLLPPGSFGKKLPYRCRVCKTREFPEGKVGDLVKRRFKDMMYFLSKHLQCPMHQKYLRKSEQPHVTAHGAEGEEKMERCKGLCVEDALNAGHLYRFRKEFDIWAIFANISERASHSYWLDKNTGAWHIKSHKCLGEVPEYHDQCQECRKLGEANGAPRLFFGAGMCL